MLGNVWEWTNDFYERDYYKTSPVDDPHGPLKGYDKVARGGSWYGILQSVRFSYRHNLEPDYKANDVGFRCAEYADRVLQLPASEIHGDSRSASSASGAFV